MLKRKLNESQRSKNYYDLSKYPGKYLLPKSFWFNVSQKTIEGLNYLVHDKKQIMKFGKKSIELTEAFKLIKSTTNNGHLYRGLYLNEIDEFLNNKTTKTENYFSFSEDLKVAKGFAGQTKTILVLNKPKNLFPYWKFAVDDNRFLKYFYPEDYEDYDGPGLLETALYEKEWILNISTKLRKIHTEKKSGYQFIHVILD